MMRLSERSREIAPGEPAPALDVSSIRGELDAIRKSVKQIRDAAWNLERARDESGDEDRKQTYRGLKDVMDDAHGKLAPIFKELQKGQPEPEPVERPEPLDRPAATQREPFGEQEQPGSYAKPQGFSAYAMPKEKPEPKDPDKRLAVFKDQPADEPQAFKPSTLIMKGEPKKAKPKEDADPDDDSVEVVRRGHVATGMDRTTPISQIYAAREAKMNLGKSLREAQGALEKFQDSWYPGPTTWNPTRGQAEQGGYRLGDKFVGQVDSIAAGHADLPPHPAHVAKAISDAAHEMYAGGRQTEWTFPWFVYGMPGLLPEGVIVTQEEVYRAIRKLAGEHAVTPEYRDEVITELNKLGHKVTTHRPQTHERMIWTH